MLDAPAYAARLASPTQGVTAMQVAWACFAFGMAWCYILVFPRAAGLVPLAALGVGFVFFHVGLAASVVALLRGVQRGWLASLVSNAVPVAVFWLAVWSVPAFAARFP